MSFFWRINREKKRTKLDVISQKYKIHEILDFTAPERSNDADWNLPIFNGMTNDAKQRPVCLSKLELNCKLEIVGEPKHRRNKCGS